MYRYPEAMGRMVSWEKFTIIFKVFRDCWTILKEAKHTISTEGRVGGRVLLLDGGGGERRTITMQGGVGRGCNSKNYLLMELFLDRRNYFNRFFE